MVTMPETTESTISSRGKSVTRPGIRDVHVKCVPEAIWLRARQNALTSGMAFKDYLIRLLEECEPFTPGP